MKILKLTALTLILTAAAAAPAGGFERDVLSTPTGDLAITFIGHGTLMFEYGGIVVHVDPWTRFTDYSDLPKADLILVTHDHRDHFDAKAIAALEKDNTIVLLPQRVADSFGKGQVMSNADRTTVHGIDVEAVPAYNLVHMRPSGDPFHSKGAGNGYVIGFGETRVYVAGDTENVPEMKALEDISVAFLPMNLPYTMTPEMVADAATAFRPKILYPYHYGQTDPALLVALLEGETDIEVRVRPMQ
jgi:L-ascorbate metabolism protein UlaG (beta-lactamase superfamily)